MELLENHRNKAIIMGDYKYTRYYDYTLGNDAYHVEVLDKSKTEYGPIAFEIKGIPVEDFTRTFAGCVNLVVPPVIPQSAIYMSSTFEGCTSLTTANIPEFVWQADGTFRGCTSLVVAPEIPKSVEDKYGIFDGCTSLMTAADEILSGNEKLSVPSGTDENDSHDEH